MNKLPKLVRVDWYMGDVSYEKPILEHNGYYYFDPKDNGSNWAYKGWCIIIN